MNAHEYECPNCQETILVPDAENESGYCNECHIGLVVDRDGEFVDGSWKDRTTLTAVPDFWVLQAMKKFGGSFVAALSEAGRRADDMNLLRIKKAWPEYWAKYTKMGYKLLQEDMTKP